jgi:hypothetical protein
LNRQDAKNAKERPRENQAAEAEGNAQNPNTELTAFCQVFPSLYFLGVLGVLAV